MTGSPRYRGFAFLVPRTGRPCGRRVDCRAAAGGGAVGATASLAGDSAAGAAAPSAGGSCVASGGSAAGATAPSAGRRSVGVGGDASDATASSSLSQSLSSPPPDVTAGTDGAGSRIGGRKHAESSNTTVCDCVNRPSSNSTRYPLETSGPSRPRKQPGTPHGSSLCWYVCGLLGLCTHTRHPN
jgi:hypothetical protein